MMVDYTSTYDAEMNTLNQKEDAYPFPVQFPKIMTYSKRQRAQILHAILSENPMRQQELTGLFNGLRWLSYRDQLLEQFQVEERALTMPLSMIVQEDSAMYDSLTTLLSYRTNLECPPEVYETALYEELSPRAYMFFLPTMIVACLQQIEQLPSPLFDKTFERLCTLDSFHVERYGYCFDRTYINEFLKLYNKNPYFERYHHLISYSLTKYWD